MDRLNVELESVDLIWCEGTIDGVGFEEMPGCWNSFLKPNGYVAVTCPSWLIDDRVAEVDDFWTEAGSGPDTVAQNVDVLQKAGSLGSFWSKTAYWEKKTRSLSRPWSTRLNLGKFFRRSGTMTLSATFPTWENSRAALLLVRVFVAYCGKRRKMACERYKEFSQQGIFDHGVGRARARLEWEAFCQSPALKASEGTCWTNGSSGGWVGACVRGRCLRVRPAPYVDRRGVAPLTRAWPDPLAYLARAWPEPACTLGARMARSRSCARRQHVRVAVRVAGNELRPGIPNGPRHLLPMVKSNGKWLKNDLGIR